MTFSEFLKYADAMAEKEEENPAIAIYKLYVQLTEAGFSEKQAMELLKSMITAVARGVL